jgi:hypothetical protein
MSALAELEKFGYLTRKRLTNDKGQFAGVEYNIFEIPQEQKPNADNPNEEMEKADKPNTENRAQLNTNLTNHLLDKIFDILSTKEYDAELIALYREYIKMREEIKSPITEIGLEKLVDRAKELSKNSIRIEKALLETAIINNWKNVYPPRESELARLSEGLRLEMRDYFGLEE